MGKPELGIKCTCTACQERFYDLNRVPAICPKCGAEQPREKPRPSRPQRSPAPAFQRSHPPAAASDDDAESAETPDDETEDDVPELDDETDDDIEIDADRPTTTD